MALQALWAPETQFQNKNGSLLVQGKIYVQYRGRSQLAKTYRDPDGAYQNTNPLLTDNDGRVLCYADDAFSYTAVVCDFYGNELFSFDPIPCGSAGGGGSASAGTAEHWLGWNGASVAVPRDTETRLRMPAGLDNVDYDGGFLKRIESSGTEMVLEEGLYLVNAVIRFQQSSSDLTNEISNVVIHTRDFESANMQEVGATFRDEAGPDSSSDIHTISLTFIRHAYVDDVGSDRLKFAVDTPNTWTSCYIQNLQIAKLGSSVGGGGSVEQYYAGDYISIENDTISVTGIEPDTYLTSGDLDGYATEDWVSGQGYMKGLFEAEYGVTSYAAIKNAADNNKIVYCKLPQSFGDRKAFLAYESHGGDGYWFEFQYYRSNSNVSRNDSIFVYRVNSNNVWTTEERTAGNISDWNATSGRTQIINKPDLSIYATTSEMEEYVTEQTSAFITSADIPPIPEDVVTSDELANVSGEIVSQIPSLDGYATEQWVLDKNYITSADVPPQIEYSAGDNIDITDHVVSVSDSSQLIAGDNVRITVSGNDYIISAQAQETSGYVTEQEMNDAIQSATSAFITSADIPPIPEDVVTSGELANVSADIVNQIPSLDGYATEQYVQDYTSGFITSADVPEYSAGQYIDITNKTISVSPVKSLLAGENVSITASGNNYVISSQVPEDVVTSGELATVSGEIVNQIPSLHGYATEQYVQDYTSGFVDSAYVSEYVASHVSGKQDKLTFTYDSSDKINAINGSAIAGGGGGGSYTAGEFIDITNDVISVNSGDVSNLIPGSGILITQSSAGTTVSIDPDEVPAGGSSETLIWTGSAYSKGTTFPLLEPMSNFRRIKTVTMPERNGTWRPAQISEFQFYDEMNENTYIQWKTENIRSNSLTEEVWYMAYYTSAADSFTLSAGMRMTNGGGSSEISEYNGALIEIYGLDRR